LQAREHFFLLSIWDRIEDNVFAEARTPRGYHDTALICSDPDDAGFSRVERASSPRMPAVSYCLGTLLRNEIEDREAGKLEAATDYAASVIAARHGSGEVAAKIQAQVIVAAV